MLRTGRRFTNEMIDKFIKDILVIAAYMFRDHPKVTKWPGAAELLNTFIFRIALCVYLLAVRWISVGGAKSARADRLRNDMVDMNFAAFATYFDGLLTADNKLIELHGEAAFVIRRLSTDKA
jgi:hypothetical protein